MERYIDGQIDSVGEYSRNRGNSLGLIDRQIDRLLDKYVYRQIDRKINRLLDKYVYRQIDRKIDRQMDIQLDRYKERQLDR